MAATLQQLLTTAQVAEPASAGGLQVFGLRWNADDGLGYSTLDDALAAATLEVTEVSEGGSVPTLLVDNVSDDHFAVRLNGLTLGTATGGRNCMLIPLEVGDIVLEFVPVGMDPQLARPVHLEESLHWRVKVGQRGTLEHDLFSLRPAAGSCNT